MAYITYAPVVRNNQRRKDGSYPVLIRITFKRKARYLPANLTVYPGDLSRKFEIRSMDVLRKCYELIAELREITDGISIFSFDNMDVDDVVALIRNAKHKEKWRKDFFEWIDEMTSRMKPTASRNYVSASRALERYIGKRELDINDITVALLKSFSEFIDNEPKQSTTPKKYIRDKQPDKKDEKKVAKPKKEACVSIRYVQYLGAAYRRAQEKYNDEDSGLILIPKNPFARIHRQLSPPQGQRSLGVENIQKMIDAADLCEAEREAVDYFLISFFLWGVNLADLYRMEKPVDGILHYRRKKVEGRRKDGARMQTLVPEFLLPVIERRKASKPGKWLCLSEKYASATIATDKINTWLKHWASRNGIPNFTFYAARHSYATIARSSRVGMDKAVVNECLCHVDELNMADVYIERDWDVLFQANEKLYAVFDTKNL